MPDSKGFGKPLALIPQDKLLDMAMHRYAHILGNCVDTCLPRLLSQIIYVDYVDMDVFSRWWNCADHPDLRSEPLIVGGESSGAP